MKFFEKYFSDVDFEYQDEVKVLCPFHDDTKPSASVNTEKSLFHCYVCGEGMNEQQFVQKVNNISAMEASKVLQKLNENLSDWFIVEKAKLWANNNFLNKTKSELHISENLIESLHLGIIHDDYNREFLGIPVLYNNIVMDTRAYNIYKHDKAPKVKSQKNAKAGWVIPYDQWLSTTDTTYVFEGEKDMLIAREQGLNAITLTGGAKAKPNEFVINAFENREIIICYDNDEAGKEGAYKLFKNIYKLAKSVKYINIGDVVKENKEDFYDYITKYNGNIFEFLSLDLHEFELIEEVEHTDTVKEALANNKIRRPLKSNVIVSGEFADTYAVPEVVVFTKTQATGAKNETMFVGETRTWYLDLGQPEQILELIELGAKKHEVIAKLKAAASIPAKEQNVRVDFKSYKTIYKVNVADGKMDNSSIALNLYSFKRMIVGKQYAIDYKIYPHPTKNQKLVAISENSKSLDNLENFRIDKTMLKKLQTTGSIEEKLNYLYQSAKHHIAKHLNYDIWLMNDLVFNSILEFEYNKKIRGALDVFVLGDTQVGKSETAEELVNLYSFGHFLSLKTSSTVGLIGGSNQIEGSWLNTIGAIPRQHKGLAILEEFSGARQDFIKTMTDIRSSGKLRLARAAGEMEVDCRLRMISISNPINDINGNPRHLSTFPNGVIPLMELISSAEDVARYDGFLLVQKPETRFNPFAFKLEGKPIDKLAYENKVLWVATRRPEHVVFSDNSDSYIWEKAEELNKMFESNFPLFTTTTSQKLARFSVALASLIVNTDEKYERVIVTKDIVDYVVKWFIQIYDNETFKLAAYKKEYDSYNTISKDEQSNLNKLYSKNAILLEFLAHQSSTTQQTMKAVSGLNNDDFSIVFNKLVQLKMVRLSKSNIYPTRKFNKGMNKVSKNLIATTDVIEADGTNNEVF